LTTFHIVKNKKLFPDVILFIIFIFFLKSIYAIYVLFIAIIFACFFFFCIFKMNFLSKFPSYLISCVYVCRCVFLLLKKSYIEGKYVFFLFSFIKNVDRLIQDKKKIANNVIWKIYNQENKNDSNKTRRH